MQNQKYKKIISTVIVICLIIVGWGALNADKVIAEERLFYENFDDQDIDQPSTGSITVYKDFLYGEIFPPEYNLTTVGRGGTGYCFSGAQDISAYLMWRYNNEWPSDEMYVSFYERFSNYTYTDPNENFKTFYPHWGDAYYVLQGRGTDCLNISINNSEGVNYNPDYCQSGVTSMYDGNWHHYEIWLKFSIGQSRFWYDGVLISDEVLPSGTWDVFDNYLTLGSADSEEPGTFLRQYDDWEVWDGLPDQSIPETCSDNIQNQDETGIDCGGVCDACVVPATYGLSNFISAITNWLGIGNETSDVNFDGIVNTRDLGVVMSNWGN